MDLVYQMLLLPGFSFASLHNILVRTLHSAGKIWLTLSCCKLSVAANCYSSFDCSLDSVHVAVSVMMLVC